MRQLLIFVLGLAVSPAFAQMDPAAAVVCNRYKDTGNQWSCLKDLGNLTFAQAAVNLCNQYSDSDPGTQERCLKNLQNLTFDPAAVNVCSRFPDKGNHESCLRDLGNFTFEQAAVNVCNRYKDTVNQWSCLKDLRNLTFDQAAVDVCNRYPNSDTSNQESCLRDLGRQSIGALIMNLKSCDDYSNTRVKLLNIFETSQVNSPVRDEVRQAVTILNQRFSICIPLESTVQVSPLGPVAR